MWIWIRWAARVTALPPLFWQARAARAHLAIAMYREVGMWFWLDHAEIEKRYGGLIQSGGGLDPDHTARPKQDAVAPDQRGTHPRDVASAGSGGAIDHQPCQPRGLENGSSGGPVGMSRSGSW